MLLVPSNLIVLDEPTNHLDMRSKAVLQEALAEFEGSLIVVSHDRDFLDPLVTKVVEFRSGSIRTYLGSVSDYLAVRHREATAAASSAVTQQQQTMTAAVSDRERKRREAEIRQERYKKVSPLQKKLAIVEKAIAGLEAEKATLEETMADSELYKGPEKIREVNAAYKTVGDKLQDLYHQWGKVSEELERLMAQYDAEMARI
jgi:ATP-binding cassette subfamily F protein 3